MKKDDVFPSLQELEKEMTVVKENASKIIPAELHDQFMNDATPSTEFFWLLVLKMWHALKYTPGVEISRPANLYSLEWNVKILYDGVLALNRLTNYDLDKVKLDLAHRDRALTTLSDTQLVHIADVQTSFVTKHLIEHFSKHTDNFDNITCCLVIAFLFFCRVHDYRVVDSMLFHLASTYTDVEPSNVHGTYYIEAVEKYFNTHQIDYNTPWLHLEHMAPQIYEY